MGDIKWIKLSTALFDNRKIKQIRKMPDGDALIVVWLQILCLAGQLNDSGMVYFSKDIPYTEEMLATEFDRPINTIRLALTVFQQFGMIEIVDSILLVSNWEKYQSADKLAKLNEQNRERQARFKSKQKSNVMLTLPVTQGNATELELELELDKELDNKSTGDKTPSHSKNNRFVKPTLDEVKAYCAERGNSVDPQRFCDYYDSNGWKVGKNPMKDWRAAVRSWEKSDAKKPAAQKPFVYTYDGEENSL